MVEATRIELVSENSFIGLSTSVVCQQRFPEKTADKQAEDSGSPNTVQGNGHSRETLTSNRRPSGSRGTLPEDGSRLKLLPVNFLYLQ